MKIIFFGLGSIGKRHVRLLQEAGGHELYALRSNFGDAAQGESGVTDLSTWEDVDKVQPQIAFITNPTALHVPTAIECGRRGMAIFMEKPVGDPLVGIEELKALVQEKNLATYVAYVLRFHPVIVKLRECIEGREIFHARGVASSYLPLWRPGRDHRQGYSAQRALGGGVITDLSHEIDYMGWLLGGVLRVSGQYGRRSDVTVDTEDYADILLECGRGPANVHIDFLSQQSRRDITIDCRDVTLCGDLIGQTVKIFRGHRLEEEISCATGPDEIFRSQSRYFFGHLSQGQMMNNIAEASDLMEKILSWRNLHASE